jgi:hypothetical protein
MILDFRGERLLPGSGMVSCHFKPFFGTRTPTGVWAARYQAISAMPRDFNDRQNWMRFLTPGKDPLIAIGTSLCQTRQPV